MLNYSFIIDIVIRSIYGSGLSTAFSNSKPKLKEKCSFFFTKRNSVNNVSGNLSSPERNYSNVDREASAIVFEITRLKKFLLTRKFTLQTDHKPLNYLLAQRDTENSIS